MKWLYPLSVGLILAVLLEAYSVQKRGETLRAEVTTESVTIMSGYGALAVPINSPSGQSRPLGTEDFGGSWLGPRW